MNYLKDAIDFAMTLQPVKDHINWRNQNNFGALGINARLVRVNPSNPNVYLVQINFDYYKKDSHIQEDFFVGIEWNGRQYVLKYLNNANELDGYEN